MIRLILLFTVGAVIYWFWKWTMGRYMSMKNRPNRTGVQESNKSTGAMSELVQDPVCKLFIAKGSAISYKGRYFCSEKCKNEFKEGK